MEYHKELRKTDGRVLRLGGPRDLQKKQRMDETINAQLIQELKDQIANLKINTTIGISAEDIDKEIRNAVENAVKETKNKYEVLIKKIKEKENNLSKQIKELTKGKNEVVVVEQQKFKKRFDIKTEELEEKYNNKISVLEDRLKLTEERVEIKEEQIKELKEEKDSTIKKLLEEQNRKMEELTKNISLKELGVDDPDRPKMESVFIDPLEADAGEGLESHIEIEEHDDVSITKKKKMQDKVDKLKDLVGQFG